MLADTVYNVYSFCRTAGGTNCLTSLLKMLDSDEKKEE